MDEQMPEEVVVRFEELGALEHEFEEAELEIIRKAEALQSPLYKKRADFVANIPHFWSLVFEQAPPEIDNFIQPTDSKVFAECLETFEVSRFELDEPNGSPRSFSLKLGFSDNEYFEDKVLEKKFWFRKTKDWQGLVSEPVKINWKKGKDLTGGLTDAAYKLGELRKKLGADTASGAARKEEAKSKEYKKLAQLIETATDASVSFFGLFSFVSGYRWEIEVFPGGDEVATIIAEDMWPNAIKYYKPVDIRALVGKGRKSGQEPPAKKQRKT
ncbi:NAP family protein [Pyrenophora tritici-repentis]|nr:nap family protein [Pyrenophora tritici-repentis]KAI0610742.1 nap family protein [Pyrenophora tritici-repentis]KAI1553906.1 NAP family protein [Pyrenophora tritici-repentis]KAI1581598.1 NAP family protein [Pyrenophora tritici-repentis]PWO22842.1 hypothetical protein PtrARCrB10_08648 [Pyrenophora tritici-repentis]